jgi:hypothetical protein
VIGALTRHHLLDDLAQAALHREQRFRETAAAGEYSIALACLSSTERMTGLSEIWHEIPTADQARTLGDAISGADMLYQEHEFLVKALIECRVRGELVTDCDRARQRFAELPDRLDVYRGTVAAEEWPDYGVSWTLEKAVAENFAAGYRCSNRDSTPILMHAKRVPKKAICGVLTDRSEHEVLILPQAFHKNRPARLPRRWRA